MKNFWLLGLIFLLGCSGFHSSELSSVLPQSGVQSNALQTTSISNGYQKPRNLAGITDQTAGIDNDVAYANLKAMNTGLRQYNLFWGNLEASGVPSNTAPINCPSGYTLVPSNSAELSTQGYHRYRCLSAAVIARYDNFIIRDAANGIQSAVALWNAPELYRYTGCTGSPFAGAILRNGCVPRDDAMDDYEDYVNFLAARYNGGAYGKIYHFIVWNENASATWFDYSPVVPNRGVPNAAQTSLWLDKYANMMVRTHTALKRHLTGVMMYASTDMLWATPAIGPADVSHIGTQTLVDGLWTRLGTGIDWSLAVHPYGDPTVAPAVGTYGFQNLQSLVIAHQNSMLLALKVTNVQIAPQSYIIASEQLPFDPNNPDLNYRAQKLCEAHSAALGIPHLVGMNHNHFYGADAYGIVPTSVAPDLHNLSSSLTGQAYQSMNPDVWGVSANHFCCQSLGLGCPGGAPASCQIIGGQSALLLNATLSRADCNFQCQNFITTHSLATCMWNGTIDLAPVASCTVVGGQGASLFSGSVTKNSCSLQCKNFYNLGHVAETCLWSGAAVN